MTSLSPHLLLWALAMLVRAVVIRSIMLSKTHFIFCPFLFEFADDSAKHTVVVFEHIILELFAPTQIASVDFKPTATHRVAPQVF